MSYTYTCKGRRYLRKFTASSPSPVYAAAIDAQTVADTLCEVPWERVPETSANFTSHDADSLDANVGRRGAFDAALFCAGHDGGLHTVYANAACYRITLPDSAVGVPLESLSVRAASDPYNAAGLRIAVLASETDEIPADCATCRTGDAYVQGAVPRTAETGADGKTYWYAAQGTVAITPASPVALRKYLLVFVVLENYATSRGNWLEGSGYIQNAITLTTTSEITGWDEVEALGESSCPVVLGGVLPPLAASAPSGFLREEVQLDGSDVLDSAGQHAPASSSITASQSVYAVHRLYRKMLSGKADVRLAKSGEAAQGAFWRVRRSSHQVPGKAAAKAAVRVWEAESSVLLVPLVMPDSFAPGVVRLDFTAVTLPEGARFNVFVASEYLDRLDESVVRNSSLYDCRDSVDGWRLAGHISEGASASFALSAGESAARYLTILVSAYMPPDAIAASTDGWQGVPTGFIPDITIK